MFGLLKGAGWICICAWLAFTPMQSQDPKIAKAREDLKEARKVLDKANEDLEAVYLLLEKDFERIQGTYAMQFIQSLENEWLKIYPELLAGLGEDPGKKTTRRRFLDYCTPLLDRIGHDKVIDIDTRIIHPIAQSAADVLYEIMRKNKPVEEAAIVDAVIDMLIPGVYFHTYWNRYLFGEIEEARQYAKANAAFDAARVELDKLEHPEHYTSRGKLAPSGMAYIPGGFYTIGPNTGWDKPRRKLIFKEFYIDKYEVTNLEFHEFLKMQDHTLYTEFVPYFWPRNINMERYYPEDLANEPVMGVCWKAAHAYAQWCGKRLPTEDEWEVAARGKQGYLYPWGNTFDRTVCNTAETGINDATDVGSFPEGVSPFGCLDMAGNAFEWTCTDQNGNRVDQFDNNIRNMVIRGGDYREGADHARADFRWMTPMDPYNGRNPSKKRIGFRCAKQVN
ncbi:MAG: SUMF1/EgtB/PvdO family nonheme iron enzyme [Planctomycetota bacterium]